MKNIIFFKKKIETFQKTFSILSEIIDPQVIKSI